MVVQRMSSVRVKFKYTNGKLFQSRRRKKGTQDASFLYVFLQRPPGSSDGLGLFLFHRRCDFYRHSKLHSRSYSPTCRRTSRQNPLLHCGFLKGRLKFGRTAWRDKALITAARSWKGAKFGALEKGPPFNTLAKSPENTRLSVFSSAEKNDVLAFERCKMYNIT